VIFSRSHMLGNEAGMVLASCIKRTGLAKKPGTNRAGAVPLFICI
jgi:hypothetical protein